MNIQFRIAIGRILDRYCCPFFVRRKKREVKNKDYAGVVSSIMGGKAESYQLLGLNVRDIVALAKADPQTAITTILTKVSTGGEPVYTAAKDLFGDKAAAPAMLLSKRVDELAQAFKGA